jgi:hypothetical protein
VDEAHAAFVRLEAAKTTVLSFQRNLTESVLRPLAAVEEECVCGVWGVCVRGWVGGCVCGWVYVLDTTTNNHRRQQQPQQVLLPRQPSPSH